MTPGRNRPMFEPTETDMDHKPTPEEELAAFIKEMDDAEDEAELNGCVPPEEVGRRLDAAIASGLRKRALDQAEAAANEERRVIRR